MLTARLDPVRQWLMTQPGQVRADDFADAWEAAYEMFLDAGGSADIDQFEFQNIAREAGIEEVTRPRAKDDRPNGLQWYCCITFPGGSVTTVGA